jgi:hypothetical protein
VKALLVRVGIDKTFGRWNAPVCAGTWEFVYVPIPEEQPNAPGFERPYSLVAPALDAFCVRRCPGAMRPPTLPPWLKDRRMHLDPDFEHLTYGDRPPRSNRLDSMDSGDLLLFYAGLRSIDPSDRELVYALVGMFTVDEVVSCAEVEADRRIENAHTRRREIDATHRVVRGRRGSSGRFDRCIPIGALKGSAYYVREDILEDWGGLSVKGGFIGRSAVPPWFLDPDRFAAWLAADMPALIPQNNP